MTRPYPEIIGSERPSTPSLLLLVIATGGAVLLIGGVPLLVAWLLPGVPPPGPFG